MKPTLAEWDEEEEDWVTVFPEDQDEDEAMDEVMESVKRMAEIMEKLENA